MRTKVLLSCFFLSILLVSCVKEPEPIKVTGITLNSENLLLYEDETADLMATISPKDADNQTVLWSSSNGSVASVNNGKVTALKAGSTTIMAKSDDGGFTASCAVTVVTKTIEVSSITLSKTELTLTEGDSETLVATVKPDDATDKTISWNSSDSSIATVEDGKVTALKEGSATITAKAGDKSATCKVTVSKRVIPVESVVLDKEELSLIEGDSYTLTATVKPDDATDKAVSWSSSDASIATVEDGKVTAVKEGSATITAKAGGKTATCSVKVEKKVIPVERIELDKSEISIEEGQSEILVATVYPEDATDKVVTWSSDNESIATVESDGTVHGISVGETMVHARISDIKASCKVTVKLSQDNTPITFADAKLKERLVAKFDTNGDGELSYGEAAAVTSIDGAITIKTITSFDEFQYFTGVTTIPDSYFKDCTKLTSISLPEGLTNIGNYAFQNCSSLSSINMPNNITSIGGYAFQNCSSISLFDMPNSVTSLGNNAFQDCSALKSITFSNSMAIIPQYTFKNCSNLTKFIIPDGVTYIGSHAFDGCSAMQSISIPEGVKYIYGFAFSGCANLESLFIPKTVEFIEIVQYITIYNYVTPFAGCSGLMSIVVDPDNPYYDSRGNCNSLIDTKRNNLIKGSNTSKIPDGVKSIQQAAFDGLSKLKSITIPESVTSIGKSAFNGCSALTSISIPESIITIEPYTFSGCSGLKNLSISESVTSIEDAAFEACSGLSSLTIPGSVSNIGENAFAGCSGLKTLFISDGVTTIRQKAFTGCSSLVSVYIPDSVTSLGSFAFSLCSSLPTISIPGSISNSGSKVFEGCSSLVSVIVEEGVKVLSGTFNNCTSLMSVSLPESLTTLLGEVFRGCSALRNITIPDGVTEIGSYTFNDCYSLESIRIPSSVTAIGYAAFNNCIGLQSITCEPIAPPKGSAYMFESTNNCPIYVPSESVNAYRADEYWSYYRSRIRAIPE